MQCSTSFGRWRSGYRATASRRPRILLVAAALLACLAVLYAMFYFIRSLAFGPPTIAARSGSFGAGRFDCQTQSLPACAYGGQRRRFCIRLCQKCNEGGEPPPWRRKLRRIKAAAIGSRLSLAAAVFVFFAGAAGAGVVATDLRGGFFGGGGLGGGFAVSGGDGLRNLLALDRTGEDGEV